MANISKISGIVVGALLRVKGLHRTILRKKKGRPFFFGSGSDNDNSQPNQPSQQPTDDGYTDPSYTFGGWIEETSSFISSLTGEATAIDDGQGGTMLKMSLTDDDTKSNSYGTYSLSNYLSNTDPQYFAISMWFKYNQADPLNQNVDLYRWDNDYGGAFGPSLSFSFKLNKNATSGEYKIVATGPQNTSNALDSYTFSTGMYDLGIDWHNIVAYVDKPNLQLKFFLDGLHIGTSTIRNQFKLYSSGAAAQEAHIGTWNRYGRANVDFSIDSVQVIYDQQFEPYQLAAVYNDSTRRRVLSNTMPSPWSNLTEDDLLERVWYSAPSTGTVINRSGMSFENKILTLSGGAGLIDGDTSYLPDGDYSMSLWFKDQTTVDGNQYAFVSLNGYNSYGGTSSASNGVAYVLDNRTSKISRTWINSYKPNFTQDYNDGNWHHLVITKKYLDGNTTKVYIDGQLIKTGTPAGLWGIKKHGFGVGKFSVGNYEPFVGQLTNLEVWDQELTSTDVTNLYLLGHAPDQDDMAISSLVINGQEAIGATTTLYVPLDYDFSDITASVSSSNITFDASSIDTSVKSLSIQTLYIYDHETDVAHPIEVPLSVGAQPNGIEDDILDYSMYYNATWTEEGTLLIGGAGSHASSMLRTRVSSVDNYPQGDTTISMWVKYPSSFSGQKSLIQFGDWSSNSAKGLYIFYDTRTGVAGTADGNNLMSSWADGHIKIRLMATGTTSSLYRYETYFKSPPIQDNEWHQIVVQFENASSDSLGNTIARVYVDGVKINDSFKGIDRAGQDVLGDQELNVAMKDTYRGAHITVGRGFHLAEFDAINIVNSITDIDYISSDYQSGRNNYQGSAGLEEHSSLTLHGNAQIIDGVLHVDGTSGTYASLPHSLDYERENGDLTVSMWIKPNSLQNNWNAGLVSKMGAGWSGWITAVSTMEADDGTGVMPEGGLQTSFFGGGNANNRSYPDGGIQLNEWQHVAFVMVAVGEYKMYHNGVEILSYNPTNRPQSTSGDLRFGGWGPFNGYEGFFDGQIDGIKIEKVAKSASEILSEYNSSL